ncbi:hypothetical protein Phum_PHUM492190 [Pediculus humanus corporis]|uniref:Uncharacterized protein n=1 Tax=Pediculus humanus subsp. corporis TaxID=121224 RepID=E0VWY4_PEDHC|nr:uncharacterized protein Phum_PHUM492190 [Pediculus humanus corporis]EEB17890.1 hypothetical protein Phum_PHUM492190 [Pediculus humanus corporis]
MLEYESLEPEIRVKRSPAAEGGSRRQERQSSVQVSPEYYNLLHQLAAQQQQQQQSQVTATTTQSPTQLYSQLVVSKDGTRQQSGGAATTRYVLSPEGGTLFQGSFSGFGQQPQQQYTTSIGSQSSYNGLTAAAPQQYVYLQSPLEQTGPQVLPPAPTYKPPPGTRPKLTEYARQQQRILQDFRDAPIRAQIAGFANGLSRPRQPPQLPQPLPTGPYSQSPQVFAASPAPSSSQQPGLPPTQYQDPQNPGIVYTTVPVDSQAYQLQQQYAQAQSPQQPQPQPQYVTQYVPESQVYAQSSRSTTVPQQVYYQPVETTQDKPRRPVAAAAAAVLPTPSSVQPQYLSQALSQQQYLIETTKPTAQPQYVHPAPEAIPQVHYVQQPQSSPAAVSGSSIRHPEIPSSPSTLLHPVAGRGYFSQGGKQPTSRSSIFVSRSSVPKSLSFTAASVAAAAADGVSSEKVPVVRLPAVPSPAPVASTEPRSYTKQEIDALIRAGYTITPVQDSRATHYLKSKRHHHHHHHSISDDRANHVVYENPQDGIQYEYSPGTSDSSISIKAKKSVTKSEGSTAKV